MGDPFRNLGQKREQTQPDPQGAAGRVQSPNSERRAGQPNQPRAEGGERSPNSERRTTQSGQQQVERPVLSPNSEHHVAQSDQPQAGRCVRSPNSEYPIGQANQWQSESRVGSPNSERRAEQSDQPQAERRVRSPNSEHPIGQANQPPADRRVRSPNSPRAGQEPSTGDVVVMHLLYQANATDPSRLYQMYVSNHSVSEFLGRHGVSGPLSQEGFQSSLDAIHSSWSQNYGIDISEPVEITLPNTIPSTPIQYEGDRTQVLDADARGNGYIGPRNVVERQIAAASVGYRLEVGDNIRGGIFGALGYAFGGDEGSHLGAAVDGLAKAAAATLGHRQLNQTLSQTPPPSQGTTLSTQMARTTPPQESSENRVRNVIDGINTPATNFRGTIYWGSWDDYQHVTVQGREYAEIGGRLYTRHAVDRMQPSGWSSGSRMATGVLGDFGHGPRGSRQPQVRQAGGDYGRSVSPSFVEHIISTTPGEPQGEGRVAYRSGSVQIIMEKGIVVTIETF